MASKLEARASQTFTSAELERMLDWYRALPACHDIVPRDDELADKIAIELTKLRALTSTR
jgi:hypothetical protein